MTTTNQKRPRDEEDKEEQLNEAARISLKNIIEQRRNLFNIGEYKLEDGEILE